MIKGSYRRQSQVSDERLTNNWATAFKVIAQEDRNTAKTTSRPQTPLEKLRTKRYNQASEATYRKRL